jgi:hypothetical protein
VIAPQAKRDFPNDMIRAPRWQDRANPNLVLEEIGLPAVETKVLDLSNSDGSSTVASAASHSVTDNAEQGSFKSQFENYLFPELFPTSRVSVKAEGSLASLASDVSRMEVPSAVQVLDLGLMKPDGRITISTGHQQSTSDQTSAVLVAEFRLGDGEVIVVGDPAIFDNRLFSQADNSVLAARLLGEPHQTIVWDEFYHGLTIRGNPLFLLTRGNYGLVALLAVALTVVWVWRKSVFLGPPLAVGTVGRRTLAEYVGAMANFLHRGTGSLSFMLSEVRRGVLWSLRRKFGSSSCQETSEDVAVAVARRDPRRARQLLDAVHAADLMLSHQSRANHRELLKVTKDLLDCL